MNREDERIRKMFQELKAEDEHNAPSFPHDWNAALSRTDRPRHRWAVWQMSAATAITLILLGTGWWMFFRQSTTQVTPVEVSTAATPVPNILPPVISLSAPQIPSTGSVSSVHTTASAVSRTPTHAGTSHYIAARQHPIRRPQTPTALISQWSSPTESLLRITGEQLFKRVPRLDDSVV